MSRASARGGAAWPTLFLALVLVAAKAATWGLPSATYVGLRDYAADIVAVTFLDVLFAAALGAVAGLVLRLFAVSPRLQEGLRLAYVAFCAACAVYAVASVKIYAFLRSPLTYALVYVAGDMGNMRSSIGSFLSPGVVAGFLAAPLFVIVGTWWARRRHARPPWLATRRRAAVVAALVAAWLGRGYWVLEHSSWRDRDDHLLVDNPHWTLVSSYATELLLGGRQTRLDVKFAPEDLDDFHPLGVRGARTARLRPAAGAAARPGWHPQNLVLLILESTSARYLSLYGSRYPTTPRLEAEAKHAAVFDGVYAHVGLSANSLASLALSIYPYMTWREYTVEYPDFPGVTVAELLKERGCRTAFLQSGELAYAGQDRFLRHRGYDLLQDSHDFGGEFISSWGGDDRALMDAALKWIDADPGRKQPFFITAWTAESHHPYEASSAWKPIDFFQGGPLPPDDWDLGRYLNTLREVDEQIGRLFDGLRERGLAEDTLVVIVGDHGESFGDPHPTWGHGARVYETGLRVPFLAWNPRLFPEGRRASTVGGLVDLNPTLADLMGLPVSPSWHGRSLFAADRPPRAYFYATNNDYLLGVRDGQWKYIYNATRGRDELYDLAADPLEQSNLAEAQPQRCDRLRARLAAWREYVGRHLADARGTGSAVKTAVD